MRIRGGAATELGLARGIVHGHGGRARDHDAGSVPGRGRHDGGDDAEHLADGDRRRRVLVHPGGRGRRRGRRGLHAHRGRHAGAASSQGLRGPGRRQRRRDLCGDGHGARGHAERYRGPAGHAHRRERRAGGHGHGGPARGARRGHGHAGRQREHGPGCRRHAHLYMDTDRRGRPARHAVGCECSQAGLHGAVGSHGGDATSRSQLRGDGYRRAVRRGYGHGDDLAHLGSGHHGGHGPMRRRARTRSSG